MYPQAVCVALLADVGVVAVGHVPVFRKAVDPVRVLVPRVHQGKAVVARCANQAVGMTLKHSSHFSLISSYLRESCRARKAGN